MEKKVQGRGNARRGRVTTAEGWIGGGEGKGGRGREKNKKREGERENV